jgi:hypothetical protein
MTQFIYTHHQGGEGKMVEKATMSEPPLPLAFNYQDSKPEEYDRACNNYLERLSIYRDHIRSLIYYDALGFSPSDNGKTFGEKDFKVKVYHKCENDVIRNYPSVVCSHCRPDKEWENFKVAVPLSEKREESSYNLNSGRVDKFQTVATVKKHERMFTLEEMKDAWDAALQSMELHQSLKTSKQQYFQSKFSITLK